MGPEELMTGDYGEEIVGLVFGFEPVATDGAVGALQVAWLPRAGPGSRRLRKRTCGVEGTGGVVDGLGGKGSF